MDLTTEPEPWLRGPLAGIPAHLMPVFFSFIQVREDLSKHTAGVTDQQLWSQIVGKHSLGYHLKHIAGSVDRLTTYLLGNQLSQEQLAFLLDEHTADANLADLLNLVNQNLQTAEEQLLLVKPSDLAQPRFVGRHLLPTTVIGLLVHVCEHSQRHLGQAILIAKLLHV